MNGINGVHGTTNDSPYTRLCSILSDNPELFLQPTSEIQQAAVQAAKSVIDPLAKNVADAQLARRNENRRKRKRGDDEEEEPILQLRQVYTKGFGVKQVWEQARRVLDSACYEISRELELHSVAKSGEGEVLTGYGTEDDMSLSGDEANNDTEGADGNLDSDLEDVVEDEEMEDDVDDEMELEDQNDLEEDEGIEEGSDIDGSSSDEFSSAKETFLQDKHGLNDGFFSIDDFNKQSQFLEQMDVRGDDDNPSDEDDIDWAADPMSMSFAKPKLGKDDDDDERDENEDEEDGPVFGDAKLEFSEDDASIEEDGEGLEDSMGMSNANDVRYADFFEPPPKKLSKTKRMRALPKTQPVKDPETDRNDKDAVQNDIERAIADVRRDLLDSDEEDDLSEEDDKSSDELGPRKTKQAGKNLSTHEKQRAAIAAEIRQLEAANVSKRDWQLSGEARAADRPLNSLIEEDLEFERAGKPVPVITAETSEEIEQLIKRRILAREFDEVIRRQPGAINSATETRRGRVEVDDTKPQAGLGEIYEQEHLKNTDPSTYVDKRSAATKKQHEQIDILWREVNDQLNALSNLHFKPKRVDLELKTVEDKPRIAMEDARPVGDLEAGEGGMLAPQEVYRPGTDNNLIKSEVQIGKTGATKHKEELSREEKLRRRRREKERNKKSAENREQIVLGRNKDSNQKKSSGKKAKEQDQADIISDLKKGNVKIIGKGGELQTIEKGKGKKGVQDNRSGDIVTSNLKL